jgi:hypothetical protein
MNKDNYCSLGTCQKIVEAGIVLETEAVYVKLFKGYKLRMKDSFSFREEDDYIPAPTMAELWRELPEYITNGSTIQYLEMGKTGSKTYAAYDFADDYVLFDNPTDALAELLIWVKEQNKESIINKLLSHADKLKW